MIEQHILQVSELTKKVRFMLESELNRVWLSGEISNFVSASSGHWYLSLKDNKSQVRCAMFKGNNRQVRLSPRNGQQVLVRAKVSLYEPRGDFQLIIEQMEDAGEGILRQQFEQLKQLLNAQGLFSQAHKVPLPSVINTVGVVTSSTGAALQDILTVLHRRNPHLRVIIYPAIVQGKQGAPDIIEAINIANDRNECDVLIVGRGGGSLEDLWCFNEEAVVRAIYNSKLPIISAIGHEIDTTLSDYVADVRAATPSAAAEIVSNDSQHLSLRASELRLRLQGLIKRKVENSHQLLSQTSHLLNRVHPARQLQNQQQRADEMASRLNQAINRSLQDFAHRPKELANHLHFFSPDKRVEQLTTTFADLNNRLIKAVNNKHQQSDKQFRHLVSQLQIVSPLATIARGYSVTRDDNNKIINRLNQVEVDSAISIQVNDGHISAKVTQLNEK